MTTLLLGELLPRKIALHWPERIACWIARPMAIFAMMAGPLSRCLETDDRVVGPAAGRPVHGSATDHPGRDQGAALGGDQGGRVRGGRVRHLQAGLPVLRTPGPGADDPRDEVVWIDVADSPDEIRRKVIGSPHSRFPVCDQSLDNLLGIVQVKDLLAQNSGGPTFRIKGLLTLPAFIYEGTRGAADPGDPQEVVHAYRRGARRIWLGGRPAHTQ